MSEAQKNIDLYLGFPATDKVTGFDGIITSVSFDLYGCVQVAVTPKAEKGEYKFGQWMDVTRLTLGTDRVMPVPDFTQGYIAEGKKGPSAKMPQH